MPSDPTNIASIRSRNVEKNSAKMLEAADQVITGFNTILRLSGMKNGTVLAINAETGKTEYEIYCIPVGENS